MKAARRGGFLLARAHQEAGRVFADLLQRHGVELSPAQGRIMFPLWRHGPAPMGELAARCSLGKSTLTSMIDRLEREGWVTRVRDPEDRRRILLAPTARDRDVQGLYVRVSTEMTELFYAGFSEAERDMFEAMLERLLGNLENSEPVRQREPARCGQPGMT